MVNYIIVYMDYTDSIRWQHYNEIRHCRSPEYSREYRYIHGEYRQTVKIFTIYSIGPGTDSKSILEHT